MGSGYLQVQGQLYGYVALYNYGFLVCAIAQGFLSCVFAVYRVLGSFGLGAG